MAWLSRCCFAFPLFLHPQRARRPRARFAGALRYSAKEVDNPGAALTVHPVPAALSATSLSLHPQRPALLGAEQGSFFLSRHTGLDPEYT